MSTESERSTSMIGEYGAWAAELTGDEPGRYSLRRADAPNPDIWRAGARAQLRARLAQPDTGNVPQTAVHAVHEFDGLHIEELSWQLPYGPRTDGYFLRPANTSEALPGVLALHCHSGNKYLGKRKVACTSDHIHPSAKELHDRNYEGVPWANRLAKRGYAVLVPDAFAFASRRVRLADVPDVLRDGLTDDDPESADNIQAYNSWAAQHESIMAKSLFSAGTTWPGVFSAEDQRALDILCARPEVDPNRVGCGGLSGGGLRTVMLAGLDDRVRCAVCVGMMTTWRDYLLNRSVNHTWMIYVPLLAPELDYPEILGLRAPLPSLVLNNTDDPLFTLPEMERADDMLRAVYAKVGAPDAYQCRFHAGGHKFDLAMQAEAFAWFDQWLSDGSHSSRAA